MLSQPEKRTLARLPLQVLMRLRIPGTAGYLYAETRDVSARGIYFYTYYLPVVGEAVECVLVFPEELTQAAAPTLVACSGHVLRVENLRDGRNGIALEVSSYDFSGQSDFVPVLHKALS